MTIPIIMKDQREEIAAIINKELQAIEFDIVFDDLKRDDIFLVHPNGINNIIGFREGKDPINKIFSHLSKNRYKDYGRFHHFKSVPRALQIIESKSIQISSLHSNDLNDFAEYTEFFKRVGSYHQLVPSNFQAKAFDNKINPSEERPGDVERQHIFVLCLTQDNHNERFWKNYAKEDSGVAIGFEFSGFEEETKQFYNFRDVFYDSGYSFEFYNAIDYQLRKYNKMLFADGIVQFAKFYKRANFSWENETRLCFHHDAPGSIGLSKYLDTVLPIQIEEPSGRRFINFPLESHDKKNPFFKLSLVEVACGKCVSKEDYQLLQSTLKKSYPNARIWQRS